MEPKIEQLILHKVGNKLNDDKIIFSKSEMDINDNSKTLLNRYFISSIKKDEYYTFYHESEISLNEVYTYVSRIFNSKDCFFNDSINIAKHLYQKSEHPKIKEGDLYVVYFSNIQIEDKVVDAIGIFKSENKETFIKVENIFNRFEVNFELGANINKLDKGCIIYNIEKENGFLVSLIDNLSKTGSEARYWKDDFLYVKPRKDEYYNTQHLLSLCKNFVTKEMPQQFDVSRADQVDLLNKSVQFFKENENFELANFTNEVIGQPELIESFNQYKTAFQKEREIAISDSFSISESAVKKQARSIKSIIKLDKNFHIYVHGSRELIEQGVDEGGRKFYKIYYSEEY